MSSGLKRDKATLFYELWKTLVRLERKIHL